MENIIDITGNEENNSEEEMSSPTTPRKLSLDNLRTSSSFVWSHFIKDVNYKTNKKVTCNYCQKIYICSGGSTSGITKHLKNVHNIAEDQNKPGEISVLDMLQAPKVNI